MSLRLILFFIAIAVIGWIVWDHNNKNKKRNTYRSSKKPDARSLGFVSSPKPSKKGKHNLAEDIDREVYASDSTASFAHHREFEQANVNTNPATRKKVIVDSSVDPDFEDNDFDFMTDEEKDSMMASKAGGAYNTDYDQDIDDQDFDDPFADPFNDPFAEPSSPARRDNQMSFDDPQSNTRNRPAVSRAEVAQPTVNKAPAAPAKAPIKPASNNDQMNAVEHKVFTIFIKAKNDETFNGDDLLQVLLSLGCRYGKMNIFHRHEQTSGQGRVLFSIASMVKPGTFDINDMQSAKIPGIALFFTYPGTYAPLMVFDLMLKTGYRLAKHLNADILDENRELLTTDSAQEMRDYVELIEMKEFF